MRIVNISYVRVPEFSDPIQWLNRIDFSVCILEALALHAEVHSFHHIAHHGTLARRGVTYHFTGASTLELLFPSGLHSELISLRPDVILVHGLSFPWQALLLTRAMDPHVRIWIQHHADRIPRIHKRILQRFVDPAIQGYFFTAGEQSDKWVSMNLIANGRKVQEVMECSSVFDASNSPADTREEMMVRGTNYLWVGRLDENKDPVVLVKGFMEFSANCPHATLYVIFRDGDLLPHVQSLAGSYPSIRLVGTVRHEKLGSWYASADFIISTSHHEGSGVAVCEGMSCGCIPILSDIPSFQMMTGRGACGLLFSAGDVDSLVASLHRSQNLDLKEEKRKVLQQFEQYLSPAAIAQGMLSAFNSPEV